MAAVAFEGHDGRVVSVWTAPVGPQCVEESGGRTPRGRRRAPLHV